ncbi:MAG: hypothetical protein ABIR54_00425 [Burkholderiaceae bacterium]
MFNRAGAWIKPTLLGVIDDRTRRGCRLQGYLDESAQSRRTVPFALGEFKGV